MNVVRLIDENAGRHPDRIALFGSASERAAAAFQSAGIGKGDAVALMSHKLTVPRWITFLRTVVQSGFFLTAAWPRRPKSWIRQRKAWISFSGKVMKYKLREEHTHV